MYSNVGIQKVNQNKQIQAKEEKKKNLTNKPKTGTKQTCSELHNKSLAIAYL